MAASEASADSRRRPLLMALFWVGIGLAPLAALLLLLGQGTGPLRLAAVLAVLAVVLIGLSITFRGDAGTIRLDVEEMVLDEIDALREDLRNDIATAARATHRAFGEKLQVVHDNVEALRGQLEAGRTEPWHGPERAGYDQGESPPGTYLAAVHPKSVAHYAAGDEHQPAPAPAGGRASVPVAAIPMPRTPVSGGVVRHTETVHVTTRHTIVDPHGQDAAAGRVYGGAVYGGHDAEPGGARGDGRAVAQQGEPRWPRSYDDGSAEDDGWSGMRSGDRWAAVRSDEHGRELRMGERRAAVHADGSGSEFRVEDRWAAVRREEPRRDGGWRDDDRRGDGSGWRDDDRRGDGSGWRDDDRRGDGSGWRDDDRRGDGPGWRDDRWDRREQVPDDRSWERRGGPAALPAGGADQAGWASGWVEPEREPVRRAPRDRYEESGYAYPPVDRGRQVDYGYSDDRWR